MPTRTERPDGALRATAVEIDDRGRSHAGRALLSCMLLAAILPAAFGHPAGATSRPTGPLSPSSGALFGAHVAPETGWTQSEVQAAVGKLETDLGRKLSIDLHFMPWTSEFPGWQEPWDLSNGRTPLISWGSTYTSQINSGSQDAWITARANEAKTLGKKFFLRWFADMDANSLAARTGTPAQFIAAWRRVHDIFVARGATNAVWVWCPTAYGFSTGEAQTLYPGDAYVDWICADGYNWAPGQQGASWDSLTDIFTPFYTWASAKPKPLMIGETGVQERATGEKAQWMTAARAALKTSFPAVQAVVYVDAITSFDWHVDTSAASFSAFKAWAADPYFKPGAAGTLLGAYVQPGGAGSQAETKTAVTQLETDMGRKLDIDAHYYRWDLAFPTWRESWDISNGRIPTITWASVSTSQINAGTHDPLIRARADGVKALGQPIFLRYFAEMDATANQDRAVSGSSFVSAWKRIFNIFEARGATNVIWVWCPTSYGFDVGRVGPFYPGDAFVDWVCADGFNWAPGKPNAAWASFKDVFADFYAWGTTHGKPMMVGETGTEERNASEKAQWITDARNVIKTTYPQIKALVYFDANSTDFSGDWFDWRLRTSTIAFNAWKQMGLDAHFRPMHTTILG